MSPAAMRLLDASAVVEALRAQAGASMMSTDERDRPVANAWDKALEKLRSACKAYVEET